MVEQIFFPLEQARDAIGEHDQENTLPSKKRSGRPQTLEVRPLVPSCRIFWPSVEVSHVSTSILKDDAKIRNFINIGGMLT